MTEKLPESRRKQRDRVASLRGGYNGDIRWVRWMTSGGDIGDILQAVPAST